MFKFSFIILSVSAVLGASSSLMLQEAIEKALQNHPDIQKSSLQVKRAQSAEKIARADYLPQINLNAEYDPLRTYTLPANGVFNTKDSDGWLVNATLNQKIWDFSKTSLSIEAGEIEQNAAEQSLLDIKALLVYKVKLQYELMLVQREAIKVREEDVKVKEELYKQAQAFVELGMKTDADATRFLSALYRAKDNLAIAEANFFKAKTVLSLYIGQEIDKNVILQNTLGKRKVVTTNEQSVLEASPALKSLQNSLKKDELNYKAAKASHYGSIDAIASYTLQNTLNEYDSSLIGLTLRVPLYSGGRTSAQVEQGIINKQSSQANVNAKELALKEEFATLMIDLKRYEKSIESKELEIKASTQTQRVLEARYKEGLATYIEMLDVNTFTLDAKLSLLQSLYERSSTIHRLEYLQGKLK
ncbi:TolC family protein [Sulfurimonas aquatica]|uniref:TolC family protein n=1 Tax=Sulfurimonas aquatica TaxID=2672570 RepID=A0A975AY17_9BACT|nr:TolC family protein [Sulfurimonas aquatica]QSZ40669.1 TolC family protein [Sulfurimonas aquatica]